MIRFLTVQGDVLVDDVKNRSSQMATSGLELDETGNYLIATTQNSSAQINANGKIISLGQSSFMRVGRRGDPWVESHHQTWQRDFKTFIGKLWSLIDRDPRNPDWGGERRRRRSRLTTTGKLKRIPRDPGEVSQQRAYSFR
jgi:hypothetical protein